MEGHQKFLAFLVILAASICNVQSEEIEIDEGYSHTISCPAGHGINIDSSQWNMKYWDAENMFVPTNWRYGFYNVAYVFGGCSYDRTAKIKELCFGHNQCTLTPTTDLLGGCNYHKYLRVYYWCQPCEPSRKRRGVGDSHRFAHVGLVHVIGVCNLITRLPPKRYDCPNLQFVGKHVCTNCHDTAYSAGLFAIQVANMRANGNTVQTNKNTVFIASNMGYRQNSRYCVFDAYAPKYDCSFDSVWNCTRQGDVIASHDPSSGHYDPDLDYYNTFGHDLKF